MNFKSTSVGDMIQNIKMSDMMFDQKIRVKKPKPTRERPSVEGDYSSVFIPYGNLTPYQIKDTLLEVAWSVYAAAVSRQRHKLPEPFTGQSLTRPKGGLSSFLYNRLGIGITSKQGEGKKDENPNERDKIKAESDKKRMDAEKTTGLKVFTVAEPTQNQKKLKNLIQKPKPQLDAKCSHDKRIIFNPKCQIFYRDADLVIEGTENLEDNEGRVDFEEGNNTNKNIVITSKEEKKEEKKE